MTEHMAGIGRGDNYGRVVPQSQQKWFGNFIVGTSQPKEYQPTIVRLYTGKHLLRKRPGLAKLEPAGALEVMS